MHASTVSLSLHLPVYLYHFLPRLSRELSPACDSALRESDWHFAVSVGVCTVFLIQIFRAFVIFCADMWNPRASLILVEFCTQAVESRGSYCLEYWRWHSWNIKLAVAMGFKVNENPIIQNSLPPSCIYALRLWDLQWHVIQRKVWLINCKLLGSWWGCAWKFQQSNKAGKESVSVKSFTDNAINGICFNILKVKLMLCNRGWWMLAYNRACFSFISPTEKLFTHLLGMLFNTSHDFTIIDTAFKFRWEKMTPL